MDVKRAIRWLKLNIASFGGDPNFIVLSGKSNMTRRHHDPQLLTDWRIWQQQETLLVLT